jgi:hypothetical protein
MAAGLAPCGRLVAGWGRVVAAGFEISMEKFGEPFPLEKFPVKISRKTGNGTKVEIFHGKVEN